MAAPKKGARKPGFIPTGSESTGGTSFVPDLGPVTREQPPTKVQSCSPYLLKVHPERWTVCGDRIVPAFGRLVLQPGVNGMSDLGGRLRAGDARNMSEEAGWTIVPFASIPDSHQTAGQPKSYLYQPVGRPDVTLLIYERCYPGSDRIERDTVRYIEFCEYLMDLGIVPPPKLYALHKLREKLVKERDSFADKAQEHSSYKASLVVAQSHLDAVDAAIAEREAGESVQPSHRSTPTIEADGLI